ncbi:MAG: DUF4252 domain-containing protein [Acidobacteriia bacterium]|nr:DUF4252 domain-containing protein [Terriglobia bacterium]
MKIRSVHAVILSCSSLLLALATGGPAYGQNPRLEIKQLDKLASKAAEVVDVTLDDSMLKLASKFVAADHDAESAEFQELVKNLKGVYVKSFEFDKEGEYSDADVEAIRSQLKSSAWSRMVGVRSKRDNELSEVYLMTEGATQKILGLAIIAAEPKELTVVNIVGPIDIDKLSALEGKMGIPRMDLEKNKQPKPSPGQPKPSPGGQDEKK